MIVPFLGWIGAIAGFFYSLYLLYLALPKLMKVPEDKAAGYVVVVILATFIVAAVLASLAYPFGMGRYLYGY
jgi:hypothetical protein